MTCSAGSRGLNEHWTHGTSKWEQVRHGHWEKTKPKTLPQLEPHWWTNDLGLQANANWAHMDWQLTHPSSHNDTEHSTTQATNSNSNTQQNQHDQTGCQNDIYASSTPHCQKHWPGNRRLKPDGNPRARGKGKSPSWHRRGKKKSGDENQEDGNDTELSFYFANPTSFSEKAKK